MDLRLRWKVAIGTKAPHFSSRFHLYSMWCGVNYTPISASLPLRDRLKAFRGERLPVTGIPLPITDTKGQKGEVGTV